MIDHSRAFLITDRSSGITYRVQGQNRSVYNPIRNQTISQVKLQQYYLSLTCKYLFSSLFQKYPPLENNICKAQLTDLCGLTFTSSLLIVFAVKILSVSDTAFLSDLLGAKTLRRVQILGCTGLGVSLWMKLIKQKLGQQFLIDRARMRLQR